jgi:structure-specific endonuclease subunit SLX1
MLRCFNPKWATSFYIGFTNNTARRIRQHNGELGAGAKKTRKKRPWDMILFVYGFPTKHCALQFEWAWKFYSRKLSSSLFPMERRKQALDTLLSLERPTSKAIAYSEWNAPPSVVWENTNTDL